MSIQPAKRMTKLERTRECAHCAISFVARRCQIEAGRGKYCSHRCAFDGGAHANLFTEQAQEKSLENRRLSIKINGTKHRKGEANHKWKGGKDAYRDRYRDREREYRVAYRAKNPEKVREFARKRRQSMLQKLPTGTVKKIGASQKWLCVVCRNSIRKEFHIDHINPLALGGVNEASNIQLLCPSCNLRKSAKDPIDFMQERGFLL
mgnify:FL=1